MDGIFSRQIPNMKHERNTVPSIIDFLRSKKLIDFLVLQKKNIGFLSLRSLLLLGL